MLPHYSPLKVAETFSMLAGLYPGRIDLGLGRAPGTDPMTTLALQRDRRHAAPDDFPEQLAELLGLLEDTLPPDHPFAPATRSSLPGPPGAARAVAARLLAAERDLGGRARPALRVRRLHQPAGRGDRRRLPRRASPTPSGSRAPRVTVVRDRASCAETDEEAERLASSEPDDVRAAAPRAG